MAVRKRFLSLLAILSLTWGMEDIYANPMFDCGLFQTSCFCTYNTENYELQCPSAEEPSVLVKYAPNVTLDIDCLDNPNRNLFTLPNLTAQGIRGMSFRNCTLPSEGLDTLSSKFKLVTLEVLEIVLTNFEYVQLSSDFFGVIKTSLEQLKLEGNGLTNVPLDTFEGMQNLLVLDLNSNELTELPARYFRHVPKLKQLDLSRNLIATIAEDAFHGLEELTLLHLWSNRLKTLPSKLFSSTSSLQSLELSINRLEYLPEGIFDHLDSLTHINVRSNNFSELESGLFKRNAKLKSIRLDSNRNLRTLPKGLLSKLSTLTDVQAFDCGFRELPGDLFRGSNNLSKLLLRNNDLSALPDDIFLGLERLEDLELKNNQIGSISPKLFESLLALKKLDLSRNSLSILQLDHFKSLSKLEQLSLNDNNISDIIGRAFIGMDNLSVLDLSHNDLTLIQEGAPSNYFVDNYERLFDGLFNLEELDLSYNRIVYFQVQWLMNKSKFKRISLQHNHIDKLEYADFQTTSNEKEVRVHLDHNLISTVDFSGALALASTNINSTVFVVQLAGNPWRCDCNMYDLVRYYHLLLDPQVRARVELTSNEAEPMTCSTPKQYRNKLLTDFPLSALTCPLLPPLDITYCPNGCTCHYRPFEHTVIVDCVQRNLTVLPTLSTSTNNTDVQQKQSMRVAGLTWNGNGSASGGSLEVWAQQNKIERVEKMQGYDEVALLDLSGNRVVEVKWLPGKLKTLKLHNNNIQELGDDILDALNETINITLDNNPWKCDCNAVGLSNLLRDRFNDKDVRCDRSGLLLRKLTQSELCPSNMKIILMICLGVFIPLCLCAFLAAFYYRYQRPIKVWLFAHPITQWLVTQEDLDKDKSYDAFMCYAHEDEDYVEKLLKELEGGDQPYKVCIHRRDWMPGAMIATQINDSIQQSRRTIVVLSPAFVRSEWARMEFRTAHASDLKEGRARLIVIRLGHLDPKVLQEDEELQAYCSTKTYLQHDDPQFWQKLRYAMPHRGYRKPAPVVSSPSGGKVSRLNQIMVNIERQDLCAAPTTPNSGTTPPALSLADNEETLLRKLDPLECLIMSGKLNGLHNSTATA